MRTIKQNETVPSWVKYITQRIKKNKNFLGFISGSTGSGKSYASLSMGSLLDEEFNIERVVFSPKELMQLINSDKLHSGSVIIFEEAGVNMSSRNWQSITNKMLNFLMQTFRHRNFILIMNAPFLDFADAQTRRLFHAEFRTQGIDFSKKETILKPYCIQYNGRIQKFYYKYLRVHKAGYGSSIPVTAWRVPKPADDLLAAYEVKKRAFTDALNKEILAEIESASSDSPAKRKLTFQQERFLKFIKEGKNMEELMRLTNVRKSTAYKLMTDIQNKGYDIKPVYDDNGGVIRYESM